MTEVAQNDAKLTEHVSANPAVQTQNASTVRMSQQVNGPSSELKNEIVSQQVHQLKQPPDPITSGQPSLQSAGPFLTRPPLNRVDSRQNFQYRPPFPNTVNQPSGPHSIGPQPHHLAGQPPDLGGHQLRPQQQVLRPPVSPQFVQRGPPLGPGGTQGPRAPGSPFTQNQARPTFRPPQTPFPRPPLLGQRPHIFQQSSVPAFNRPRPNLEDTLNRSLTLDSLEIENQKNADSGKGGLGDQRPPSAASLERSFSGTSPSPSGDMKQANGSQESLNMSRQGSLENVHRKEDVVPSRPESRPASRMDRINENEDRTLNNNTRPESRGPDAASGDNLVARSPNEDVMEDRNSKSSSNEKTEDAELKRADLDPKLTGKSNNKGDNDSGVDESTQGNDQSCNGDSRTPRKPNKSRTASTTPTKGRSASRGSKTPSSSLQSPDSAATTPGSAEKKKVPMNKIQVGSAPSPNLKVVKSKIGSLENAHYKPGGGKVRIESKKLDFKNAGPRIEAKNDKYLPKTGERKEISSARSVKSDTPRRIITQKLEWNAKSKIGSLENATYKPKGGDKKIESVKLDFKEKAKPKVGSKDNIKHQPGGGDVKIENKKIELHVSSKVGSLDNVKHKPTGGEKKIFDDKDYLKHKSGKSSMEHSLSGSQQSVQSQEPKAPVADENLNQEH